MYCKNCGTRVDETRENFCSNCGTKIDIVKPIENTNVQNKNDQTFLIIGIVLAFCCSMPFGVAIILMNEMKYKPQLREGNQEASDKTKKIMIILAIVGLLSGLLISGLSFFVELASSFE